MTTSHWGDLTPAADADFGIAVLEREQLIKPRSMEIDGPRLYQPSSQHQPPSTAQTTAGLAVDPVIRHTIELTKYAGRLKKMIAFVQQHYNNESADELNFPPTPEMPVFQQPSSTVRRSEPLPFVYKDVDKPKEEFNVTQLDDDHCRKLTRRAVAVLMAHAGLETCALSILETMTDLCTEHIVRTATALRRARDTEATNGQSGFPDIISHVFHETGLGEVTKMHDFYQERVVDYHTHMTGTCEKLREKYEQVKNPEYRNTNEFKSATMKEELMSDIQFPTFTEEDPTAPCHSGGASDQLLGLDVDEVAAAVQDEKWIKSEQKMDYDDVSDDGSPTPDLEAVNERGVLVGVSAMMGGHTANKVLRKIE